MVTVYTAKDCGFCPQVKKFLDYKRVKYEEIDADVDNRKEIQALTGEVRVPVVVTDKGISIGYNLSALNEIIS